MEKTRTYVSLLNKDLSTSKLSCKLCRLKNCFKYNLIFLLSYIRSCRVTMLYLECYISTNKIWFWNLFLLNYNAMLLITISIMYIFYCRQLGIYFIEKKEGIPEAWPVCEKSCIGFIEAVHQWKMPHHWRPIAHAQWAH